MIMPVVAEKAGGLSACDPIVLDEGTMVVRHSEKRMISSTAVRFHSTPTGICLVAVDVSGKIIKKHFDRSDSMCAKATYPQ
jgi:hypothetical protein